MVSQRVKSLALLGLLAFGTLFVNAAIIPSNYNGSPESGDEQQPNSDFISQVLPFRQGGEISQHRNGGDGGALGRLARRSYYTDSAFIPYIHPRFVMEQDYPPQEQEEDLLSPPQTKRTTKGMLVDVVDFVTKGSENRNQRTGQGMRSSGR